MPCRSGSPDAEKYGEKFAMARQYDVRLISSGVYERLEGTI